MNDKQPIRFKFASHGLGDCCHAAQAMRLYLDRGYEVAVQIENNKRWIWEAAGIPIYDGPDQLPIHPYYYPGEFWDLSAPDNIGSKIAHLFEVKELPRLGPKDEVWRILCNERINGWDAVSLTALDEAKQFLKGLPEPIVLLHSKGTNWQEEKSIPDATAFALIVELVNSFNGSVITLDWDGRAPTLGHPRVRSICPYWDHMSVEQYGALLMRSDLMIGVDSGPFHLAQWFDIPTLYVSRKIPAVRCCLPSPRATYLVPAKDHEHWAARADCGLWNFAEFTGEEATVKDILFTAMQILTNQGRGFTKPARIEPDLLPGQYTYHRVGHDKRSMVLLDNGKIGTGSAGCERTWALERTPLGKVVTIYGDHGRTTCNLTMGDDGVLRGAWLHSERMAVELIPGERAPVFIETMRWDDLEDAEEGGVSITCVMNFDNPYREIGNITLPNRQAYAKRHDYHFALFGFLGSWGKLDALLSAWSYADWLFWLDTDAVITNLDIQLELIIAANPGALVITSTDRNGINAGSMLIRTDDRIKSILEDLLRRRKEFDWSSMWEQPGLSMLLWKIRDHVAIVPQEVLNSYPDHPDSIECHRWEPGDFVLHCAGMKNGDRMRILQEAVAATCTQTV